MEHIPILGGDAEQTASEELPREADSSAVNPENGQPVEARTEALRKTLQEVLGSLVSDLKGQQSDSEDEVCVGGVVEGKGINFVYYPDIQLLQIKVAGISDSIPASLTTKEVGEALGAEEGFKLISRAQGEGGGVASGQYTAVKNLL